MTLETRQLTPDEIGHIDDVLSRLCDHFHECSQYRGDEHELIAFAFYEGCAGSDHCGNIIAESAPFALGKELVTKHGFKWVMISSGEKWDYGVSHSKFTQPIDLMSLESGEWYGEEYHETLDPGEATHYSIEFFVNCAAKR